ncbi:hypothetical protein OSTOST_01628 [Ostertagia ostertagi]
MIISYLARIVLLLPDLSASDNDRLANIARTSHARLGHVGELGPDPHFNYTAAQRAHEPRTVDIGTSNFDLPDDGAESARSFGNRLRSSHKPRAEDECVPINDTLRKHLLQKQGTTLFTKHSAGTSFAYVLLHILVLVTLPFTFLLVLSLNNSRIARRNK